MRKLMILLVVVGATACAQKKSESTGSAAPQPGSAAAPTPTEIGSAAPVGSASEVGSAAPTGDGATEVAQLVVHDVGSPALGSQTIEASCVSVVLMPAGKFTVAAAWVKNCGDKTARSILWLYKRGDGPKWTEDYVGQPPKCWKGVPADIAEAVIKATKIPSC